MRADKKHIKAFSLQVTHLQQWGRVSKGLDFRALVSCTLAMSATEAGSRIVTGCSWSICSSRKLCQMRDKSEQ